MSSSPFRTPSRTLALLPVAAAVALSGCSSLESLLSGEKIDYRSGAKMQSKGLEVPPDLTQLARENRYQLPGGVVSAASSGTVVAGAAPLVAPNAVGNMRIAREGNERWLVVPTVAPDRLFPQVRSFWQENGFALAVESAEAGVIETGWAENRAKLPQDFFRRTVGRVFEGLYDSGERDRFRTRIERTADGSEVYISHRGLQEVPNATKDQTNWVPRAADPQLEAEFLTRLMVRLGTPAEQARSIVAAAPIGTSGPAAAAKARPLPGAAGSVVEVDEPFDRTWRRVGLALDRSGFTVEDRDRSAGLYFVRYVDPKEAGQEEPNFFTRLFSRGGPAGPQRYRVQVKTEGAKTLVSVLNSAGAPDSGENAKRIAAQLVADLK